MKATEHDLNLFIVGWVNASQSLDACLDEYKKALLENLKRHDFKSRFCFEDFGKQAFLHRINEFFQHNEPIERAIREAKDILNG